MAGILGGNSGATGRVDVRFGIAASGQVESATVLTNDTGVEAMNCCIVDRVLRWRFPPPKGFRDMTFLSLCYEAFLVIVGRPPPRLGKDDLHAPASFTQRPLRL